MSTSSQQGLEGFRDFSTVTEMEFQAMLAVTGRHSTDESNFPHRLHYVLDELEKDGMSSIASWQVHGRAFRVHNRDRFTKEVLPL